MEPAGVVATVTSWHVNGRVRERATRILGESRGSLRGAALSVRLLDHVPQVRAAAFAGLARYLARTTRPKPPSAWCSRAATVGTDRKRSQLCRARGDWDRVEADLRACVDSEPALRNNGRVGIYDWLTDDATRIWGCWPTISATASPNSCSGRTSTSGRVTWWPSPRKSASPSGRHRPPAAPRRPLRPRPPGRPRRRSPNRGRLQGRPGSAVRATTRGGDR